MTLRPLADAMSLADRGAAVARAECTRVTAGVEV